MSDPFAPPPAPEVERAKPPLCGAQGAHGDRCTLYRGHVAVEHRDQHSNRSWGAWEHTRKGRIVGHLIALTGEWAHIRLLADAGRHGDEGDIIQCRASFMRPEPTKKDVIS